MVKKQMVETLLDKQLRQFMAMSNLIFEPKEFSNAEKAVIYYTLDKYELCDLFESMFGLAVTGETELPPISRIISGCLLKTAKEGVEG